MSETMPLSYLEKLLPLYSDAKQKSLRYKEYLTTLFGELDNEKIAKILAFSQIKKLEDGDFLFTQGQMDTSFYIVLRGRLRVIHTNKAGVRKNLGDVTSGEPVGEFAIYTREPRTASVVAIRQTEVLEINEKSYFEIISTFPSLATSLTKFIIKRMQGNALENNKKLAPKNIAVIKLHENLNIDQWTDDVKMQLQQMAVNSRLCYESAAMEERDTYFESIDNFNGINFLLCNNEVDDWTQECIHFCDLIILIADFKSDHSITPLETQLKLHEENLLNKTCYLVLLHNDINAVPEQTPRWLQNRELSLHLHIRTWEMRDIRRFCRIILHKAIGLVLGGGGAKGAAHIGAVKAMLEAGIEIDFIGGNSAGALYGMVMAQSDFDFKKMERFSAISAKIDPTGGDFTLPFISLKTGKKMRKTLDLLYGNATIEDCWINSYCVSSNYTTAKPALFQKGYIKKTVEASIAIPGLFPPVLIDNQLYVDGAVFDNLPISHMASIVPVGYIIAVSLNAQSVQSVELPVMPSAWQLFWDKFFRTKKYKLPSVASLLINSLLLNSTNQQAINKDHATIYFEMDLIKFNLLDWSRWRQCSEAGHDQAVKQLSQLKEEKKFWMKRN